MAQMLIMAGKVVSLRALYNSWLFSFCSILFKVSKNLAVAIAGPIRRTPKVFHPNMCHQDV